MNKKLSLALLIISAISFLSALYLLFTGSVAAGGPLLITGFIALALGVRGFHSSKGFSYTIWIFTSVTASMFYPQLFVSVGEFQLKTLIVPLLQIIMFGMGSQMSFEDFTGVIKMPKGVLVGVGGALPYNAACRFRYCSYFQFFPPKSLPEYNPNRLRSQWIGFQCDVIVIARANLALAVTIGAISTLLSPFVTPFLMKWLGRSVY